MTDDTKPELARLYHKLDSVYREADTVFRLWDLGDDAPLKRWRQLRQDVEARIRELGGKHLGMRP